MSVPGITTDTHGNRYAAVPVAELDDWAWMLSRLEDWLGHAAVYGRFADGDVASILAHRASASPGDARQASEDHSLQSGTDAWKEFGR